MKIRNCSLMLGSLLLFCITAFPQHADKPNIVFILADDIGYDVLTVNGGQSFTTPNIDRLARQGMNFTRCEAQPLCCPSRFMFLTGKQNFRNYSNWGYMNPNEKTVGNLLKDAGYTTGFFGKLQLQYADAASMKKWGWDKFTVFEVTADTLPERRYKSPILIDNDGRVAESITKDKYCDDILTNRIISFIETNKKKPFFVYYPMSIGHTPFQPTPDDPEYAAWDPASGVSDTSFFASMVKYMDKKVEQIITKLKNAGLDSNTLVFFAGDNGTPTPIRYLVNGVKTAGEKGKTLEGGTHVPLVAYWPGRIAAGGINNDLTDLTDFFPTFAEAAKRTNLSAYGMLDGISLYKKLTGQSSTPPRASLFAHYSPNPGFDPLSRWARNNTYKLYDSTDAEKSGLFFNIVTDPHELNALTGRLSLAERTARSSLRAALDTAGNWPAGPQVTNAQASSVTATTAVLSANIVSAGASPLLERGTTYSITDEPYYRFSRKPDATAKLGTLSQKRTNLRPQKRYSFSIYASNSNGGNSTGYATGSFTTLSRAPLQQPSSFTASRHGTGSTARLSWSSAFFPDEGATRAGYALLYGTNPVDTVALLNGQPLRSGKEFQVLILDAALPALPPTVAEANNLLPGRTYYLRLVPFTWDGTSEATYHYLINGSLTAVLAPRENEDSLPIASTVAPGTLKTGW